MSQLPDANNILKELQTLHNDNVLEIFLPSLKSKILFRKLNIKQQKNLVLVAMDNALSLLNFNVALYDLIKDNISEPLELNSLNIFDKNSIVLSLVKDTATQKSNPSDEALSNILAKYETNNPSNIPGKTIKFNGGELKVKIPDLTTDYRFNKTLLTKYTKTPENHKEFISDVFVIEICKYIDSIIMKSGSTIKLLDYSLSEIIDIVESLPVITPITQYISQIKDIESKLNTYKNDTIEISPSLFI